MIFTDIKLTDFMGYSFKKVYFDRHFRSVHLS